MKVWIGLGCLLLTTGSAYAAPSLSNNFTADVTVTRLDYAPRSVPQKYRWYESATAKLSRFDALDDTNVVSKQIFRFLPDNTLVSCNGGPFLVPPPDKKPKEYTYLVAKDACRRKSIPAKDLRPIPRLDTSFWGNFAAQAINSGSCTSIFGNNSGTRWTQQLPESRKHKFTEVRVCVASNNSTPYWIEWRGPSRRCAPPPYNGTIPVCAIVTAAFESFTGSAPAVGLFCPSQEAAAACKLP